MSETKDEIVADLDDIERDEGVRILLAVESGSRAWGFASRDSDFDVRFIYVHNPEWYLSIDIEERRDVIERPLRGELDVNGWDIRKALRLVRKSNPPLLEWLRCPIVYRERFSFARQLREVLPLFYSPRASFHHYLHMASGNMREYLNGDIVWRKKYLYVLRPLLAMRWIESGLGPVPIEFEKLLREVLPANEIRSAIEQLIAEKRNGAELDRGPKIPAVSSFIEAEMARLESLGADQLAVTPPVGLLDELFRATLAEVWKVSADLR